MARFLTTSGTSYEIERIMIDAEKELVLISPFLKLSKTFFERLQDATRKGVKVTIIFGKDKLNTSEEKQIKKLGNIKLYFLKNLHAKCYFNENDMVITSMNMFEFSEKNNREMGVFINKEQDLSVFNQAIVEVKSIIDNSEKLFSTEKNVDQSGKFVQESPQLQHVSQYQSNNNYGACIRCARKIPFDPFRPLCSECFNTWSQFGNVDYIENCCHSCGIQSDASFAKPLCNSCFQQLPKGVKVALNNAYNY